MDSGAQGGGGRVREHLSLGGREVATRVPPSQQAPQRRSVGPDGGAGAALGTEPVIKRAIEVEGGYLLEPADAAWQDAPILL